MPNKNNKKPKQAVLLIHGIGEQYPMETLTSFVHSIAAEIETGRKPRIWYKAENMSELFDGRRLAWEAGKERPRTDFYELYWADLGINHKKKHLMRWVFRLLTTFPLKMSGRITSLWLFSWALIISFFGGIITGLYSFETFSPQLSIDNFLVSFIALILQYINIQLIVYLGDAARYFDGHPENVKFRNGVQKRGLELLKALQENEDYDKIVLVGHSLGSVIGYDLIRHLWGEYHETHQFPDLSKLTDKKKKKQFSLKENEEKGNLLKKDPTSKNLDEYQRTQINLWKDQRQIIGNAWKITDFVTLGSPLTHASLLMAKDAADLKMLQNYGMFPICPPKSEKDGEYSYAITYDLDEVGTRSIKVIKDSAPFAVTRWTNLYFPGDLIGGTLSDCFGHGVKDIKVYSNHRRWLSYLPFSHTLYWKPRLFSQQKKEKLRKDSSLRNLRDTLKLDSKKMLKKSSDQ